MTTKRDKNGKKGDAKAAEDKQAKATPRVKDLVPDEADQRELTGGNSNIMKTKHDTTKNSISNVR